MMQYSNNEIEIINTPQSVYDAFNDFIFSNDTKVLGKLIARVQLFNKVKDVPGDIVECGVFKGSGMLSWLKIRKILFPNSFRKVIGFDFFDTKKLIASLNGRDLERMKDLFSSRDFEHGTDYESILESQIKAAGYLDNEYELVSGDIGISAFDFVERRPGFKIALLYMDLDLNIPTYNALCAFWDRISTGGIVVFDEYAYHQWSETIGADRFFKDKGIKIKTLDYIAPTAYVIK